MPGAPAGDRTDSHHAPKQQFAELVDSHLSCGFFTHLYAETGRLASPTPSFTCEHLPDGRDIFDLSSLTKALATTPLVFKLAAQFRLNIGAGVESYAGGSKEGTLATIGDVLDCAPDVRGLRNALVPAVRQITLESLLTHSSGLPAWRCLFAQCNGRQRNWVEMLNDAAKNPPNVGRSVYSDVGFILLGAMIEALGAAPIDVQFDSLCFDYLQFDQRPHPLQYTPVDNLRIRCVSAGTCKLRGRELIGEVHDENCWALGGVTGHAGMFGTGPALGLFLKALARTPVGRSVLSANRARLRSGLNEALLGWRQGADSSSETFGPGPEDLENFGKAMGHMGFTGTAFWVNPSDETYAVLLTNRVISGRVSPLTRPFRRRAFELLWQLAHPS